MDDWICEEEITGTDALLRRMLLTSNAKNHSPKQLQEGTVDKILSLLLLQRDAMLIEILYILSNSLLVKDF